MAPDSRKRVEISADNASGRDDRGSTLVPMLVAGLALVIIGAGVIMQFV